MRTFGFEQNYRVPDFPLRGRESAEMAEQFERSAQACRHPWVLAAIWAHIQQYEVVGVLSGGTSPAYISKWKEFFGYLRDGTLTLSRYLEAAQVDEEIPNRYEHLSFFLSHIVQTSTKEAAALCKEGVLKTLKPTEVFEIVVDQILIPFVLQDPRTSSVTDQEIRRSINMNYLK